VLFVPKNTNINSNHSNIEVILQLAADASPCLSLVRNEQMHRSFGLLCLLIRLMLCSACKWLDLKKTLDRLVKGKFPAIMLALNSLFNSAVLASSTFLLQLWLRL